jgi:flavorubredoxin
MKTWRERCADARVRGGFTYEDRKLATGSWCTCAVGEQRSLYGANVIVFNMQQQPEDDILRDLGASYGYGFGSAVKRNMFDQAEEALEAIEDRALQLKRGAVFELP